MSALRTATPRSKLASRLDRILKTALGGDPRVVLNVKAPELLADAQSVAGVIEGAMDRARSGLVGQWVVTQAFHREAVDRDLVDSLVHPDPSVRIAAARLCGALRLADAVPWLSDLLDDPSPGVREMAVRALGNVGGRRAVDALVERMDRLPQYRVAPALARAASDIDLQMMLRTAGSVRATVTVLLACGLRRDALRTPHLIKMAQDPKCDTQVRIAACRAVAMIADPAGAHALRLLANDPDTAVRKAALRARMRISAARRDRTV